MIITQMIEKGADLAITRSESHPSRTSPPSNDESKESGIFWARTLCSPNVDRTAQGQRRADLRENCSGNPHPHEGYQKAGPHSQRSPSEKAKEEYGSALLWMSFWKAEGVELGNYRTPPMKSSAQKLAQKFSIKCHVR
jgi:hypothetical protein